MIDKAWVSGASERERDRERDRERGVGGRIDG